ncbi:hypothetical protein AAZX31_05G201100 [Glycine max]|nr:uncharacterized protein LOC114413446 isoform X1 [Glycine soja]KAG4391597.1 hypothetical protein GLYMA_05G215800v4 [Glycine max]KAH1135640.1 hypothetical protein GYH30_013397 [Glycine max]KAH1251550.1 hypothetical protein GmHk_05G014402 [Glycine max]KHM99909.1 hypothetical protein glysoja_017607 [Glycine soja]RZC13651.1 hypothetical protein D0Y65_012980 [Glycine soja]
MNKIEMAATINLSLPLLSLCKPPKFLKPPTTRFLQHEYVNSLSLSLRRRITESNTCRKRRGIVCGLPLPVDPWAPTIDSQSIASQLFAFSLFPYIGFLYFITKSKTAPNLTLFGFYFLLAFVGATIPAGIYAKVHYGTSLSNVDWLHGGAESLLTLTNLFIVLGLREGLRKAENSQRDQNASTPNSGLDE